MPEIANFLASKCVEQDPRYDYAECRVPRAEALKNLHIWFAVDSQVKFSVSFSPSYAQLSVFLVIFFFGFLSLFAAFATFVAAGTHYEYWT